MNAIITFAAKYWLEVLFSGITALFTYCLKRIYSQLEERKHRDDTFEAALKALLRDRLYQGCKHFIMVGHISTHEMENLEGLFNEYSALGGNGTVAEIWHRVRKLPIKEGV